MFFALQANRERLKNSRGISEPIKAKTAWFGITFFAVIVLKNNVVRPDLFTVEPKHRDKRAFCRQDFKVSIFCALGRLNVDL